MSREEEELLCGGEVEVTGGADGGFGRCFAFGETVGDFVADHGAEFGVGGFFLVAVADAAEVEIRAVADVALVLIGPADEAMVAIFWFHGGRSAE